MISTRNFVELTQLLKKRTFSFLVRDFVTFHARLHLSRVISRTAAFVERFWRVNHAKRAARDIPVEVCSLWRFVRPWQQPSQQGDLTSDIKLKSDKLFLPLPNLTTDQEINFMVSRPKESLSFVRLCLHPAISPHPQISIFWNLDRISIGEKNFPKGFFNYQSVKKWGLSG